MESMEDVLNALKIITFLLVFLMRMLIDARAACSILLEHNKLDY